MITESIGLRSINKHLCIFSRLHLIYVNVRVPSLLLLRDLKVPHVRTRRNVLYNKEWRWKTFSLLFFWPMLSLLTGGHFLLPFFQHLLCSKMKKGPYLRPGQAQLNGSHFDMAALRVEPPDFLQAAMRTTAGRWAAMSFLPGRNEKM